MFFKIICSSSGLIILKLLTTFWSIFKIGTYGVFLTEVIGFDSRYKLNLADPFERYIVYAQRKCYSYVNFEVIWVKNSDGIYKKKINPS